MDKISLYRSQINKVDSKLVALLNERALLALKMGTEKRKKDLAVVDKKREREVVDQAVLVSQGLLLDKDVKRIFRKIISASRQIQKRMTVAYLGPPGTFSFVAALQKFPQAVLVPTKTIGEAIVEVSRQETDRTVVPLENSVNGPIKETVQGLQQHPNLQVSQEFPIPIHLALLAKTDNSSLLAKGKKNKIRRKGIKALASRKNVFDQCSEWIGQNLPRARKINTRSTAEAAQLAFKDSNLGAIGHQSLGKRYDLQVLARRIENDKNNQTKFIVLKRK